MLTKYKSFLFITGILFTLFISLLCLPLVAEYLDTQQDSFSEFSDTAQTQASSDLVKPVLINELAILKLPNNLFIVSHLGEVTKDTRYVGDVIRYKIYYFNGSGRPTNIGILDNLDKNLSNVVVFNGGVYRERTRAVVWEIKNVLPDQGGSVEFEATIGNAKSISNRAYISVGGRKYTGTNIVQTTVCEQPGEGWVPFDGVSQPGEPPRSVIKDETTSDIMVNFDIPGMYTHDVNVDRVAYQRLSIPGHATLQNIGRPALPIVGQIVEIPYGVKFSIEIVQSKSSDLTCYNVIPAQKPVGRQSISIGKDIIGKDIIIGKNINIINKADEFIIDKAAYLKDAYYPAELAKIEAEDIGVIRGHRVLFLKVNPIQYNPVTRQMRVFSNIEVKLNYDRPGQIQPIGRRIESSAFEEMLGASVLNYKDLVRFDRADEVTNEGSGCDYLIITHGNFYNSKDANNPVVKLRNWKQQKGLKTWVVDVANVPGGNTADNIKSYIQNAYDTWYPAPTYVLLVGDAEFIPTNYKTAHELHRNTLIGTDLYYVTVDNEDNDHPDCFPDIYIGRLSVDTLAETQTVIDKILAYEQNPPANANFYTDTPLVCLFEDDTDSVRDACPEDGREDCTFRIIEFAEEIRTYLTNNHYNVERIYDQSGNFAQGPLRYEDGTNLPANLTVAGGFPWNGGAADTTAAINNGRFLVTYDGHGNRTAWGRPSFNNANINALTNGNLTPVVFSLACMNGWFDNETDDAVLDTGNNDVCLSETFLRKNNGGAVATFGATRISWEHNDFMMLGMFKAIWSDFNPNPPLAAPLPNIQGSPLYKMGQILTFSKVYMAKYCTADVYRLQSFEMYHVFGDPEMPIWTHAPARLKVSHPDGIGSTGEQDFVVKVTEDATGNPVQSAAVVLTRNNAIIKTDQTNPAGIVRFTVNNIGSGNITITATAHNYQYYEGTIRVAASGAVLNRLEPNNGPENQVVHVGGQNFSGAENVDIYLDTTLMKTKAAVGGSFGQAGVEDVDITIPSPYDLGPVNVLAYGRTSHRYAVDVFQVRTENPIDLYMYDQWDNSTWHLHPGDNPVWNNPDIQLYDDANNPVESNNLTALTNYKIKASVHNDTNFDANSVKVTFKWADFGVGQPDRVWNDIGIEPVEIDVPRHSTREAEVDWAPPSTGHLCVMATIYHIEDINESNNKGQENCHIGPTSSPASVPFLVWNPTDKPAMVYFELRQLTQQTGQSYAVRLWPTAIKHPDPQLLAPGDRREVVITIDPDRVDAKTGEQAEFTLTGFIDGRIIGGANFIIIKR